MLPLTFDWAQISYIGSPLMTPFWAAANVMGGLAIVMWIIAPIMCMYCPVDVGWKGHVLIIIDYANAFYSSYLPILSSSVFDNTAKEYDVSRILTKDFLFDEEAYHKYSKVFLPITWVVSISAGMKLNVSQICPLVRPSVCSSDSAGDAYCMLARQRHLEAVGKSHAGVAISP
jgi:hypothetical protein